MAQETLTPGTLLKSALHTYKIEGILGRGGFGVTYRASFQQTIGNIKAKVQLAIKEHFPSAYAQREGSHVIPFGSQADVFHRSIADFKAEAKRLYDLGCAHPNIVGVNEVFEANGTAYYVMQYVEGSSLDAYIKDHGSLTLEESLSLMQPMLDATAYLHSRRINHLDIKPDNIMLHAEDDESARFTPILIDFGLSIHYDEKGKKTRTRGTLGASDGYSPYEQYMGLTSFSPKADVYSLAATMLHMLTGKKPPKADELDPEEVAKQLAELGIPEGIRNALKRALSPLSKTRTASAVDFASELGIAITAYTDDKGNANPKKKHSSDPNATTVILNKKRKSQGNTEQTGYIQPEKNPTPQRKWLIIATIAILVAVGVVWSILSVMDTHGTPLPPTPVPDTTQLATDTITPSNKEEEEVITEQTAEGKESQEGEKTGGQTSKEKPNKQKEDNISSTQEEKKPSVSNGPGDNGPVDKGIVKIGMGEYHGPLKYGRPHGDGYCILKSPRRFGDNEAVKLIGIWQNGSIVNGKYFDANGVFLSDY